MLLHLLALSLMTADAGVATTATVSTASTASTTTKTSPDAGVAQVAQAAMTPEVKTLVARVQAFYENTQNFVADFRQDYAYKSFKRTQTSSGKVTYKKPALMRWDYEKPSPRTFVLSGERVYAYDPEAKLLTRAALATNQLSASVTFLWGQGKLADEFSIAQKPCTTCKGTLLELTPLHPDPRFRKVSLEVDPASAQVLKSIVTDPDGSENAISFIGLKTNTDVDAGVFKLSPPPGTQVQDFTSFGAGKPDAG